MKFTRARASLLVVVLGAGAMAGAVFVGCGGDDTSLTSDDGGTDASTDHSAQPDTSMPDGGPKMDSSMNDSSVSDSPMGMDVVDLDVQPDVVPLVELPAAANTASCLALKTCCALDAGTWDQASCEKDLVAQSGYGIVFAYMASYDGGNVAYDKVKAAACLAEMANVPCGRVPDNVYVQLKTDCTGAAVGLLPNDGGTGCVTSIECQPGGYCVPGVDGGPSSCRALQPLGGPCKTDDQCSYLGLGTPASYCYNDGGGPLGACAPQLGLDAGCVSDNDCVSEMCLSICANESVFSDPGVPMGLCAGYTLP
jgi:hypothetical protein